MRKFPPQQKTVTDSWLKTLNSGRLNKYSSTYDQRVESVKKKYSLAKNDLVSFPVEQF